MVIILVSPRSPLWTPQPEKHPSPILCQSTTNSFAGSIASSACPSPSHSEVILKYIHSFKFNYFIFQTMMNVQPTNLRRFSAGIQSNSNNLAKNGTAIIRNQLGQNGAERWGNN